MFNVKRVFEDGSAEVEVNGAIFNLHPHKLFAERPTPICPEGILKKEWEEVLELSSMTLLDFYRLLNTQIEAHEKWIF